VTLKKLRDRVVCDKKQSVYTNYSERRVVESRMVDFQQVNGVDSCSITTLGFQLGYAGRIANRAKLALRALIIHA